MLDLLAPQLVQIQLCTHARHLLRGIRNADRPGEKTQHIIDGRGGRENRPLWQEADPSLLPRTAHRAMDHPSSDPLNARDCSKERRFPGTIYADNRSDTSAEGIGDRTEPELGSSALKDDIDEPKAVLQHLTCPTKQTDYAIHQVRNLLIAFRHQYATSLVLTQLPGGSGQNGSTSLTRYRPYAYTFDGFNEVTTFLVCQSLVPLSATSLTNLNAESLRIDDGTRL